MLVTTGKVNGGTIEVEPGSLPEGATVTMLATEDSEVFELNSSDEARLCPKSRLDERGTEAVATGWFQRGYPLASASGSVPDCSSDAQSAVFGQDHEAMILAAIAEAERGEVKHASEILQ